jgi:hypothetical protein
MQDELELHALPGYRPLSRGGASQETLAYISEAKEEVLQYEELRSAKPYICRLDPQGFKNTELLPSSKIKHWDMLKVAQLHEGQVS